MFKNYLKIAFRNLVKNKATSFINITGLAVGMACCLMIFLYVNHEFSYDGFHEDGDRIFRVLTIDEALGVTSNMVGITLPPLGPAMQDAFPEVEESTRILGNGRTLLTYGEKNIYTQDVIYAEPSIFTLFDYELKTGDPETALSRPYTAVFTESLAKNVFGDEDAVGKSFVMDNDNDNPIEIVGIAADTPPNSHFRYDMMVSLYPAEQDSNVAQFLASWGTIAMRTYVKLDNAASEENVETKMETLIREREVSNNFKVTLQPLKDVHLGSKNILFDGYNADKTDISYLYSLLAVAAFVILIAGFNFMNLSTARSTSRAKEVGMRKVVGALRPQLIAQYLGETVLLCFLSLVLSLALVEIFAPMLGLPITGSYTLHLFSDPVVAASILVITLLIGLLAGGYPAIILSAFRPVMVLKGSFRTSKSGIWLRRVLVVMQFTASIGMIIATLLVYQQLNFMRHKNIGFDREQVVAINLGDPEVRQTSEALVNELNQNPAIVSTAQSTTLPARGFGRTGIQPEGASEEDVWIVSIMAFNDEFIPAMGMEMAAGRNFSRDHPSDRSESILINEAAAAAMGWDNPIGKTISQGGNPLNVVGVVKDFHFANMRHKIEPLIMRYNPDPLGTLTIRIQPEDISGTLAFIESTWQKINPSHPFEYSFVDEEFEQLYRSDQGFAQLVINFTVLAILIACLGLFGLATFSAEQRTKEVGIRKALGATIPGIVVLLSKEFIKLVSLAFLIASPLAYFLMEGWLADFAYRIDIGWQIFLFAGILALAIALISVSFNAIKAALANPVKTLRYE